jgi:hypothetical protein
VLFVDAHETLADDQSHRASYVERGRGVVPRVSRDVSPRNIQSGFGEHWRVAGRNEGLHSAQYETVMALAMM